MKRIIASACLILTFACGSLSPIQAQERNTPRGRTRKHTTVNRPPKIDSVETSSGTVTIPCPDWSPTSIPCTPNADYTVTLTTHASDPDGDALRYEYSVKEGQITGEGPRVSWEYRGLKPNTYTVKVIVTDGRGGTTSGSISINLIECPICDLPCPTISMSCPEETEEGGPITFGVSVSGGGNFNLTYNWSVSAGSITGGQGTTHIQVDTAGLGGQKVAATIEIGGLPPECDRARSCEVQIRKK